MNTDHSLDDIDMASEAVNDALGDLGLLDDDMAPPLDLDAAQKLVENLLDRAGYSQARDYPPEVVFDIADDSDLAWGISIHTNRIRTHPRLANWWLLTNAAAGWLNPSEITGPGYRRDLITLLRLVKGDDAADAAAETFTEFGLTIPAAT